MSASKPSFVSYVDLGMESHEMNGNGNDVKPYSVPKPKLLPGEHVLGEAQSILKFSLFSDKKKGLNGSLFCTNFRVSYITSALEEGEPDWKKNTFMAENDVPLTCIHSLYQVSKGKRKRLLPGSKLPKRPSVLEIHCKDFRVHVFYLKYADKVQTKQLVNEILKAVLIEREKELFGFMYKGAKEYESDELTFQYPSDWDQETRRTGARNWKTVQINQNHSLSMVLPEVVVVPMMSRTPELKFAAQQFVDQRLPTWCYSLGNQACLVRMACLIPDSAHSDVEEKMMQTIKSTNDGRLQIVDLSKQCPTLQELKVSLDKLRDICLPLSSKDLRQTDDNWFSGLESSRWLVYLSQCLQVSLSISETMKRGISVIVREPNAGDYCCLVASLVQIILDPYYRTKSGFEALVRKEWLCMGHKFLSRLGLIQNQESEEAPVFQLFLDCIWQLMIQYPASFEFSETYLTALSDSTHLGVFSEFMFNNQYEAKKWVKECGKYNRSKFLTVWNWSVQFSPRFQTLFYNPLFEAKKFAVQIENGLGEVTILTPDIEVHLLSFWSQCYLRWLSPIAILNGGAPSVYLTQCKLTQEIQLLADELEELEELEATPELRQKTKKRDLFLSLNSNLSARCPSTAEAIMTSSFPFTPLSPKEEYMAITARTVDRLDDSTAQNLSVSYSESDCSILDD